MSEPNCHFFTETLLAIEIKQTQILMNKRVYLGLSILNSSKTAIYEFWYDYIKPKYGEKVKLCYVDTGCFIVHVKTEDIYKDIAQDVETRFDTSNVEIDRPLPMGKNEKVIGLIWLRAKTYSYLKDNSDEDKKAKETKKRVIKKLKLKDYNTKTV